MTEVHPTQAEVLEAIDRIARTSDGAVLYIHLQRHLMFVPATVEAGALQSVHGERMFAARLIGLMAKGIHESVGRNNPIGSDPSSGGQRDVPIVVPRSNPVRVAGREGGSGRRVNDDTIVPGWNDNRGGS